MSITIITTGLCFAVYKDDPNTLLAFALLSPLVVDLLMCRYLKAMKFAACFIIGGVILGAFIAEDKTKSESIIYKTKNCVTLESLSNLIFNVIVVVTIVKNVHNLGKFIDILIITLLTNLSVCMVEFGVLVYLYTQNHIDTTLLVYKITYIVSTVLLLIILNKSL